MTFPTKINNVIPIFAQSFFKSENIFFLTQSNLIIILNCLKLHINYQYNLLSAISGVDYLYSKYRFHVVYELLSLTFNSRLRLKICINEISSVYSATTVFINANWWEREIWDLYGIYFENHLDLRRILTDYGFEGYPMRKDYPLSGFIELRYDQIKKRIIIESIELTQDFRSFNFETPWQ